MIENASEVEMDIRYVEQKLGIELPDNANDAIMSGHFSSEIIKRVGESFFLLHFFQ